VRASGIYERLLPFAGPRRILAQALTLFLVVIAWVFFRAVNLDAALVMLGSLFGAPGAAAMEPAFGIEAPLALILAAAAIALFAPNVIELFHADRPVLALDRANAIRTPPLLNRLAWRPSPAWGLWLGAIASVATLAILGWQSEFLYFQF
jgi:hypothetical protein